MQKTDEELYNELKDLPDFHRLPIPESWYKKFNIERPSAVNMKQYLQERMYVRDLEVPLEIRSEPEPGGVRPVLEVEQPKVEIITKTAGESPEETLKVLACSTESTETMLQQLEDRSSSLLHDDV